MLPASNRGAGMNIGFPDVCLTPMGLAPVPIPYPNFGLHAMGVPFSPNVLLTFVPALNLASMILVTMGDEGGVAHPTIKGMGRFTAGNPIVYVNLLPGINLLCPTTGNNMNNPLGAVLVPSVTNVFYTHASGGGIAELLEELASVGRLDGPPVEHEMVGPGLGRIAIRVFSADVPARVHCAIEALEAKGMESLVLDLRDNPGGELGALIELAGDFLPEGAVIGTLVDDEGDETVFRSRTARPHGFPLRILVNAQTASAAELFAECLAAHGRAAVDGGPTYGKRTAQRVLAMPGGAVFRVAAGTLRAGP